MRGVTLCSLFEVAYCHIFRSEIPFDENWAVEEDAHFGLVDTSDRTKVR
jgi:hypothetical protein